MAINPKSLTIDYRTLLKSTSISDRVQLTKSSSGQQLLSTLTPIQIGDLFPDYYKRSNPDVSGFIEATARRYRKKATGSELAPGQQYNEEAGGRGRTTDVSGLGGVGVSGRRGRTGTAQIIDPVEQKLAKMGIKLSSESEVLGGEQPAGGVLGQLIQRGESKGYNDYNRGNAGDKGPAIDFSQYTLKEVMEMQKQGKIFAVGKYQIIPDTMRSIVGPNIDLNEKFTPELQEKLYREGLIKNKRPEIYDYLTGKNNNLEAAQKAMANEWAAVGHPDFGGRSRYQGQAGNNASISVEEAAKALQKQREIIAKYRAQGMSEADAYNSGMGVALPDNTSATAKPILKEGIPEDVVKRLEKLPSGQRNKLIAEINKTIDEKYKGNVQAFNEEYSRKTQYTETHSNNLDYLYNRGGHSSRLENGKIVQTHPNDYGVDPEFAARLAAAGKAYEDQTGEKARYGELGRGKDVQSVYYGRYLKGGPLAAAPGGSRHQHGDAGDLPDSAFRKWLYSGNAQKYGLHFPHSNDAPHIQKDPGYKGSNYYTPEQKTAKTDEAVKQPNNLIPPAQVTEKQGTADKVASKPSSYTIDYAKARESIRKQTSAASLLSDTDLNARINSELDKRGIKVGEGGKVSVTPEQMDSVSKETGQDVSQYMTPAPDAAALGADLTVNDPSNITATPISDRRDTGGRENMRLYAEGKTVDVNANEGLSYNQNTNRLKITPEFRNRPEQLAEQKRTQDRQEDTQLNQAQAAPSQPQVKRPPAQRGPSWDQRFVPISHYTTDAFQRMVGVNEKFGFGAHYGYGNLNA